MAGFRWSAYVVCLLLLSSISFALVVKVSPILGSVPATNTSFQYQFNFTRGSDCSDVVYDSGIRIIGTNSGGVGVININLSNITGAPQFICEYQNSTLRKIHNITDGLFSEIRTTLRGGNFTGDVSIQNGSLYIQPSARIFLANGSLMSPTLTFTENSSIGLILSNRFGTSLQSIGVVTQNNRLSFQFSNIDFELLPQGDGTTTHDSGRIQLISTSNGFNVSSFIFGDAEATRHAIAFRTDSANPALHFWNSSDGLVINENGLDRDFRVESQANANQFFVDGGSGLASIGHGSPTADLHILMSGNNATGGILMQDTLSDSTIKAGRIKVAHYDNSEEPILMISASSGIADTGIHWGGGSAFENSATFHSFRTGLNNTGLIGQIRMYIQNNEIIMNGINTSNSGHTRNDHIFRYMFPGGVRALSINSPDQTICFFCNTTTNTTHIKVRINSSVHIEGLLLGSSGVTGTGRTYIASGINYFGGNLTVASNFVNITSVANISYINSSGMTDGTIIRLRAINSVSTDQSLCGSAGVDDCRQRVITRADSFNAQIGNGVRASGGMSQIILRNSSVMAFSHNVTLTLVYTGGEFVEVGRA